MKRILYLIALTLSASDLGRELKLAKLENLVLKEQIAAQQLERIRADFQILYAEVCKDAGLEAKDCVINLNDKTVKKGEIK